MMEVMSVLFEQSDFGLFHLLQEALSADFRPPTPASHKPSKRYA